MHFSVVVTWISESAAVEIICVPEYIVPIKMHAYVQAMIMHQIGYHEITLGIFFETIIA